MIGHPHPTEPARGRLRVAVAAAGAVLVALALMLRAGWVLPAGAVGVTALAGVAVMVVAARGNRARRAAAAFHDDPVPIRPATPAWAVPVVLGGLVTLVGVAELAFAVTRPMPHAALWPVGAADAHALAAPVGLLLIVAGVALLRRRRAAWWFALSALVAAGAVATVRTDLDGAAIAAAAAALTAWGHRAFHVAHDPRGLRAGLWRLAVVGGATVTVAATLVAAALAHAPGPWPGVQAVTRATGSLLVLDTAAVPFRPPFAWVPTAVGMLAVTAVLLAVLPVLRPRATATTPPADAARRRAGELVRAYGEDTLSFFKLRNDLQYRFSPCRRAFVGYRVRAGVLVVSGDPVGASEAFPALLRDVFAFAREHGLSVAVLGAGPALGDLYRRAGMRSVYLGDEAIVTLSRFTLEGRPVRKLRQSVTRLQRNGYRMHIVPSGSLTAREVHDLERVSALWRRGGPERGFSMAMDAPTGARQRDSLVAMALDADGTARGFLHVVPCAGGRASLSMMRRDPATPNGLTEFMLAQTMLHLRERSVTELSLNFAVFGRFIGEPRNRAEAALGRLVKLGDRHFQLERLRRFNEKFAPRWQPRTLVVEHWAGLPRAALAAMLLEGHLPSPGAGRRDRPAGTAEVPQHA